MRKIVRVLSWFWILCLGIMLVANLAYVPVRVQHGLSTDRTSTMFAGAVILALPAILALLLTATPRSRDQ